MTTAGQIVVDDTIVAVGSPLTPAPRGVVRLSGPGIHQIVVGLGIDWQDRKDAHCVESEVDLANPLGVIPVRVLIWPTRRSYTGQPSTELHTFGSLPILNALVERCLSLGARAARPGEFTLRAFLAGRLDLTQAEAVLGVIDAEHRGALDHALGQLAGNLSRPLQRLRRELLDLLADVEAGLDFVDEDIQFISDSDLLDRLQPIGQEIRQTRDQMSERGRDQSRPTIALRGLPNAGKSRLLNRLTGQESAIVADVAGTTRDVVMVPGTIADRGVVWMDTAGIEIAGGASALDQVAAQAQRQAERAGKEADIRLWCVDHSDRKVSGTIKQMRTLANDNRQSAIDLWVATKCDQSTDLKPAPAWIQTSALTGAGIDELRGSIKQSIDRLESTDSASVVGTAARCVGSLQAAETAIATAIDWVTAGEGHEYVSSELRLAVAALGEVTGAVYTDDILDRVFSRFCIGK